MARGGGDSTEQGAAPAPMPLPIMQRIRGLIDDLHALELILGEVSLEEYRAGLHSHEPRVLKEIVYPLERAYEVASNYVVELTALGLKEIGTTPVDGPTDFRQLRAEGVITQRLCDQLSSIQRARNVLQHDYPDLRATTIYEAAELQLKSIPRFLKGYAGWMRSLGYGRP